jgi:hypothetical protein
MGGTDVNLNNIHAGVTLGGSLDLGLDDLRLKELPELRAALTALPEIRATLAASITSLPTIVTSSGLQVTALPEIRTDSALRVAISEIPTIRTESEVDLGLDDIRIRELPPIQLDLAFRPFRIHLPLNFHFCIEVLGVTLFKFALCGESMVIGEEYTPHETEKCT